MVAALRSLLLLSAICSFCPSTIARNIPGDKDPYSPGGVEILPKSLSSTLEARAGDSGASDGDGDGDGDGGSGSDEFMSSSSSEGADLPGIVPGKVPTVYQPPSPGGDTVASLQRDSSRRMKLVGEDTQKTGRDVRDVAYSSEVKAQVIRKLPNPSRLVLWTDSGTADNANHFIATKPEYADNNYLYYFKQGFWPDGFMQELGEKYYPKTIICRASVGMVAGSGAPDVDVIMAWVDDVPKSIFNRFNGDSTYIGKTFAGTERAQLAANPKVQRIWLWNALKPDDPKTLVWADPDVPGAIPNGYTGPTVDRRPRSDPSWTMDAFPVDSVPLTVNGYPRE